MPERDPADRLDELVQAMLAGTAPTGTAAASVADLLAVAADLRGMPTTDFRERLGAELTRAVARMQRGADMITASAPYIREGFHTVTPYLRVERVAGLLDFVKQAFGAVETVRATGSAGGLHAEVRIDDSMVMMGGFAGIDEMPTALHLYVENADAVHQRAVAAGAVTLHGPVDQPYGDREASVRDPFGNQWYIATHTATPATGHRPAGLRAVTPYLHPRGAENLIDFLKNAFGAEEAARFQSPDGVIQNAKVGIGDSVIEMGEAHGEWQPMPAAIYVYVEDVDALYQRALRAGAISMQPPANQPYGDRTAHVQDPHGNVWYLATHVGAR
jgi:PhnB protein